MLLVRNTITFVFPLFWWINTLLECHGAVIDSHIIGRGNAGQQKKDKGKIFGRIVNGENATIENFPFQVSLRYQQQHLCGAAVLDSHWTITAAHCFDRISKKPSSFTLRIGSAHRENGGDIVRVQEILIHPIFDSVSMNSDVALLHTAPIYMRVGSIQPIALPPVSQTIDVGTSLVVSGWGQLTSTKGQLSDVLMATTVQKVRQEECSANMVAYGEITDTMMCAAATRTDACQGDSGGPLQSNGTLIGLVSWGVGCADPRYPGIYTRIAHPIVRMWINVITQL